MKADLENNVDINLFSLKNEIEGISKAYTEKCMNKENREEKSSFVKPS